MSNGADLEQVRMKICRQHAVKLLMDAAITQYRAAVLIGSPERQRALRDEAHAHLESVLDMEAEVVNMTIEMTKRGFK